ncbi:11503_t:CDS:2, partial [Entrophospora sp. SA101]
MEPNSMAWKTLSKLYCLCPKKKLRLYFVVPEDIYADFIVCTVVLRMPTVTTNQVEQYVLEIKLKVRVLIGYSHNLIRRGEHFCIKSLNTSLTADGIVSISETEFESFGKVYESSMTVSTEYFQSKSKIFCAIDLLISEPTFPNDYIYADFIVCTVVLRMPTVTTNQVEQYVLEIKLKVRVLI